MEKLSYQQKVELAEEAKRLLSKESLFNQIISGLVIEYHQNLIDSEIGSIQSQAAHAGLKALNDIKGRLRVVENDATMAKNRAGD